MKTKEDILKEIEIFSRGADGYSPIIIDILKNIERDFGGVEEFYIGEIGKKFKIEEKEVVDTLKMLGIKIIESIETTEIRVCLGHTCSERGSKAILDRFKKELKIDVDETTKDGKVKLTVQRCFGRCAIGPNVKVGEDILSGYSVDKVEETIKKIRE